MIGKSRKNMYLLSLVAIAALFLIGACSSAGSGGGLPDLTGPTVTLTMPTDSATGTAINGTITATFSEEMDAATITENFTVANGSTPVAGTVTYNASLKTAVFTPNSDLSANTVYTATVTTGVTNEAGSAMAENKSWTFTTGAEADTTAPTVASTLPADLATGIAINSTISVTFSEAMNPATITAATFTLKSGSTSVAGTVTYDIPNAAAIFASDSNLNVETTYTATVTTSVTDEAGNAMAQDKSWTFTTAEEGLGPEPVKLGTAGSFAILAKTGVSTVPASDITGDVGVSPAAETYLTGFSQTKATGYSTSPQVSGYLYAADMTPPTPSKMTTAVSDMETAYTDAAGRPTPDHINLGSGNIGGKTLAPGLYKWGSSVTVPSDVTISGAANDVWIFQMSGDLTVSNNMSVSLSGNAQARNIFWQVAGEAILGAGSHFEGVILSQTAITVGTGASMNGRALAQTQVALDQATVTEPAQ